MREGWREATLGKVLEVIDRRCGTNGPTQVLSITEKRGIVPQEAVFRKRIATSDLSRYKMLEPLDIAYNPYLLWAGAIGQWLGSEAGVTSPVYECFRVRSSAQPRFLGLLLESGILTPYFDSTAIGSIQRRRRTTTSVFLGAPLLLPPLDEQRRIVDLITTVDEAIQGSESEAIAARMLLGALRTELIDHSDAPRLKLSDVLETVDGGRSPVTEGRPPGPGERGVLKLSAVRTGQFDFAESKAVSPAVSLPASALVSLGDVLITRSNTPETVGAVCFVDEVRPQTYLSDLTLRLTPRPDCLPAYLAAALTTPEARRQITSSAKGTSGSMRKISRQTIAELTIPLPDRDHQQSVVSLLDAAAATVKSVHASRAALLRLRSSLLSDLLSGDHEIPASYDEVMG